MVTLVELLAEVLSNICASIDNDNKGWLLRLCTTCKSLHTAALPLLYRDVELYWLGIIRFLKRLIANHSLASYVRKLTIDPSRDFDRREADSLLRRPGVLPLEWWSAFRESSEDDVFSFLVCAILLRTRNVTTLVLETSIAQQRNYFSWPSRLNGVLPTNFLANLRSVEACDNARYMRHCEYSHNNSLVRFRDLFNRNLLRRLRICSHGVLMYPHQPLVLNGIRGLDLEGQGIEGGDLVRMLGDCPNLVSLTLWLERTYARARHGDDPCDPDIDLIIDALKPQRQQMKNLCLMGINLSPNHNSAVRHDTVFDHIVTTFGALETLEVSSVYFIDLRAYLANTGDLPNFNFGESYSRTGLWHESFDRVCETPLKLKHLVTHNSGPCMLSFLTHVGFKKREAYPNLRVIELDDTQYWCREWRPDLIAIKQTMENQDLELKHAGDDDPLFSEPLDWDVARYWPDFDDIALHIPCVDPACRKLDGSVHYFGDKRDFQMHMEVIHRVDNINNDLRLTSNRHQRAEIRKRKRKNQEDWQRQIALWQAGQANDDTLMVRI